MTSEILLILFISTLLLVFLLLLGLRLIRVLGRNYRKRVKEQPVRRDLLFETLHEQTIRERKALAKSKQSTLALEALNDLHRTMMAHLPLNVLVLDRDACIQYANPHFMDLMSLDQVTGQPLADISPILFKAFSQHEESTLNFETTLEIEIGGKTRFLSITLSPLPEDRRLFTLVDKTRLHHLEEQVRYKRELELMGEMAGGVTHEVKNALAVIQGRVQLLSHGDVPEHSAEIMKEIKRLLSFIQAFMKSSKGATPEMAPVEIGPWFQELASYWVGHPLGERVVFESPHSNLVVNGDVDHLSALLRNLILNGLQACENLSDQDPLVCISAEEQNDRIVVVVQDRGPGFSSDIRQKIFVPFVTSKETGSGLGLFHCRKIMMEHGGRLEIIHEPPTRIKCIFPKPES